MHVFRATGFVGVPVETDEMAPCWFDTQDLPYGEIAVCQITTYPLDSRFGAFRNDTNVNLSADLVGCTLADQMWADDRHWYPLFLKGSLFKGEFFFTETTSLVDHTLEEVVDLREETLRRM